MSSFVQWISWDHTLKLLGALGFVLSVWNVVGASRRSTVNPQPELLAELRRYLDIARRNSSQLGVNLNFDKSLLESGHKPNVPLRPPEFDDAIKRMPELALTITSVGQKQISTLHMLVNSVNERWITLQACLDAQPVSLNALDAARHLRRHCLIVEKFFPAYVDALTRINKGNLWKRFKYRDHHKITYKLFRWKPLSDAVLEYDKLLMELQRAL